MQQARHADGEKKLGYADLCRMLTRWRNGEPMASGRLAPWLAEDNADRVGALNVLRRGEAWLSCEGQDTADASAGWEPTARIACEVSPIGGQQQEPAEATAQGFGRA